MLFRCRLGLTFARVAQDEQAPLFIRDVDAAAGIHQHIFGLRHQLRDWLRSKAFDRGRRNEPFHFPGQMCVLDVEDPEPRIEVRQVNQIALLLYVGETVLEG